MTIPAGDIRGVESRHCPALYDKILEDLVQGGPHVNVAISEWRPVMQDKQRTIRMLFLNLPIKIVRFPPSQNFRFPDGEIGFHREFGLRQIQGVFIVHAKDTETSIERENRKRTPTRAVRQPLPLITSSRRRLNFETALLPRNRPVFPDRRLPQPEIAGAPALPSAAETSVLAQDPEQCRDP